MSLRFFFLSLLFGIASLVAAESATTTTLDNLNTIYFHAELAKIRDNAFATKADEEGYKGIAVLFRAAATTKIMRMERFGPLIKAQSGIAPTDVGDDLKMNIGTTTQNLTELIASAKAESTTYYSAFVAQAESEKLTAVVKTLKGAAHVSGEHLKLLEDAANNLETWKIANPLFVCQDCAWIGTDPKLESCPVCKAPKEKFTEVK